MSKQVKTSPKFGQFGSSVDEICCGPAGLQDLYCYSYSAAQYSSGRFFTRSCSTATKDYPDNGAVLDKQWGYEWGGDNPERVVMHSKAAWQNNIVAQLEATSGCYAAGYDIAGTNAHSYRLIDSNNVVPLALQVQSRETSSRWSNTAPFVTHTGKFEARSPLVLGGYSLRYDPLLPLYGAVSVEENSLATFETRRSDVLLSTRFRHDEDFNFGGAVFRFQDKNNYLRAVVQKTPDPLFAVQEVVDGVVTTLASEPITNPRLFTPNNFNDRVNPVPSGVSFLDEVTFKSLTITLKGASIKANLFLPINHENFDVNDDVDITLNTSSSNFQDATRHGMYSEVGEMSVDFLDARSAISADALQPSAKILLSIYDDGVPAQIGELDVSDKYETLLHMYSATASNDFLFGNVAGTIVAGGEKVLWMYPPPKPDEEDEHPDPTIYGGGIQFTANNCCYLFNMEQTESDDEDPEHYTVGAPVVEAVNNSGTWEFTTYQPYTTRLRADKYDSSSIQKFDYYDYQLGEFALPVFAQHSYPLAAGWRMTGVTWEAGSEEGLWDVSVTHEFVAGPVIWSIFRDLPRIDDDELQVIYSFEETFDDLPLGGDGTIGDPTEEYVRYYITLINNSEIPDRNDQFNAVGSGGLSCPLHYFEADPNLDAFILGWFSGYYEIFGNKLGVAKINVGSGFEHEFNWGGNFSLTLGSGVVAPGGKIAFTDMVYADGDDPREDQIEKFRFAVHLPDGTSIVHYTSKADEDWPPAVHIMATGDMDAKRFKVIGCSDEYIYVKGIAMDQPEADAFAGHSLPVIDRGTNWESHWWFGLCWLISWDGNVKVPCLKKTPYYPDYVSIEAGSSLQSFWGFDHRIDQVFDCIKDSTLPHAPNFSLSEEGEVPFVHDFNHHYQHYSGLPEDSVGGQGVHLLQLGLGLRTWTAPLGCTEITVEAWGGSGGGAGGSGPALNPFDS